LNNITSSVDNTEDIFVETVVKGHPLHVAGLTLHYNSFNKESENQMYREEVHKKNQFKRRHKNSNILIHIVGLD
jgi:hypothetical protein